MHSIRAKITAITIAAILTTIVAVFAACYSTVRIENDRRSVEMMNMICNDTGRAIERYLESIEQSVETAANLADDTLDSVVLFDCDAGNPERTDEQQEKLNEYMREYGKNLEDLFESVASHTKGIASYYYCLDPDISSTEKGFFYSKAGKTGFKQREPLVISGPEDTDADSYKWYYSTVSRGRPAWVGPYKSKSMGDMWICSYLAPVYRAGILIGVIGMDIPAESLVNEVSSINVYKSGFACLFNSEGVTIYHPEQETGDSFDDLSRSVKDEVFEKKGSGDELLIYTVGAQERQMAFTTLSEGMKLIVTAPTSEVNASWMHLARIIILITLAIIAVFAVIVMLIMKEITRPLLSLTAAADRLAASDYDVELNYSSKDEVGKLTAAFSQMRDRIRSYIDDLNHRVNTDALTDLPNMRFFFELATAERERLEKEGRQPVMLYFDLIGMRDYNRQYGFEEGDKLICDIGRIIREHCGENCMCRLGDDHFAAVSSLDAFEKTLDAIFSDSLEANDGISLPVRVGVYPNSLEEVGVSIACDRAKYACNMHRNSYVSGWYMFNDVMLKQIENARYIISHLDQALEERWVKVFYQPIVSAASGRICDEEALSRWIDPEQGMLSPAVFIPVLEDARLIYKLDLYVLDRMIEKMKLQMEAGLQVVPHSLNLSRSDFDTCDIVEEIRRRVDDAGIDRSRLTIEVTESMVGSDFEFMKKRIEEFQALGFKVWMDDFGSGYSALDVLQNIHFDLLKFDMLFMERFEESDESRIILTELMKMASELGSETVCEGVETSDQAEFLREIGCTRLQGYYFSRPLPYEELAERLKSGELAGYEDI